MLPACHPEEQRDEGSHKVSTPGERSLAALGMTRKSGSLPPVILRSTATKDPIRFPRRMLPACHPEEQRDEGSQAGFRAGRRDPSPALGRTAHPAQAAILSRSPYGLPPGGSPRLRTAHSLRGGSGGRLGEAPRVFFLPPARRILSFTKERMGVAKRKTNGINHLPQTQQVRINMRFFAALRMTGREIPRCARDDTESGSLPPVILRSASDEGSQVGFHIVRMREILNPVGDPFLQHFFS